MLFGLFWCIIPSHAEKQGRMADTRFPSRVRVGRSNDEEGCWGIWAGAVGSRRSKAPKK